MLASYLSIYLFICLFIVSHLCFNLTPYSILGSNTG